MPIFKLEPRQIRKIREADPDLSTVDLAAGMNLPRTTVSNVRNYLTYQECEPKPDPVAFELKRKYGIGYEAALRIARDFDIHFEEEEVDGEETDRSEEGEEEGREGGEKEE